MHHRLAKAVLGTLTGGAVLLIASCSILATRPVQEFSDTASALRAAREVQADTLAPELYREAGEWWIKARREYKFKNFHFAKEYALKARQLAEQAEFESLRNGGNRSEQIPDPMAQATAPDTTATPTPTATPDAIGQPEGIPVEDYDKIKAERDEEKAKDVNQAPNLDTNPTSVNRTNPYGGGTPQTRGSGGTGTGGTGTGTGTTGTGTGTGTSP